jgi:hypothetical protein
VPITFWFGLVWFGLVWFGLVWFVLFYLFFALMPKTAKFSLLELRRLSRLSEDAKYAAHAQIVIYSGHRWETHLTLNHLANIESVYRFCDKRKRN